MADGMSLMEHSRLRAGGGRRRGLAGVGAVGWGRRGGARIDKGLERWGERQLEGVGRQTAPGVSCVAPRAEARSRSISPLSRPWTASSRQHVRTGGACSPGARRAGYTCLHARAAAVTGFPCAQACTRQRVIKGQRFVSGHPSAGRLWPDLAPQTKWRRWPRAAGSAPAHRAPSPPGRRARLDKSRFPAAFDC
eukprot:scaffold1447_cov115-Isochrysis_galbana.AAC.9